MEILSSSENALEVSWSSDLLSKRDLDLSFLWDIWRRKEFSYKELTVDTKNSSAGFNTYDPVDKIPKTLSEFKDFLLKNFFTESDYNNLSKEEKRNFLEKRIKTWAIVVELGSYEITIGKERLNNLATGKLNDRDTLYIISGSISREEIDRMMNILQQIDNYNKE